MSLIAPDLIERSFFISDSGQKGTILVHSTVTYSEVLKTLELDETDHYVDLIDGVYHVEKIYTFASWKKNISENLKTSRDYKTPFIVKDLLHPSVVYSPRIDGGYFYGIEKKEHILISFSPLISNIVFIKIKTK